MQILQSSSLLIIDHLGLSVLTDQSGRGCPNCPGGPRGLSGEGGQGRPGPQCGPDCQGVQVV